MDVTIEREALLRILARSQGVVDKRHSMAVLTNALLEADGKSLSLVATDLEVSLKQTVDAKVKTPGAAAVSARTLFEIVRESATDTVRLSSLDNQWLRVSYGKSEFKLMGIDPAEYPGMPKQGSDGADPVSIDVAPGDFTDMIRKTVFSVSTDDTRSNLAGIFLTKGEKKGTLRMVATDGHRLAMIDRPVSASLSEGVILPRKGLAEEIPGLQKSRARRSLKNRQGRSRCFAPHPQADLDPVQRTSSRRAFCPGRISARNIRQQPGYGRGQRGNSGRL